jgi:hypothetical protein
MDPSNTVTVYSFRTYAGHAEVPSLAPYKAPIEVIMAIGGEIVCGTEEKVHANELNDSGHYQRQATGWGELS